MTAHRPFARYSLALAALVLASAACADETVVALSPAAKAKLLDEAAERHVNAIDELPVNGLSRKPHGEVGMFVGSHGSHGIYGSTVAPIGETGWVAVSAENSRYGR